AAPFTINEMWLSRGSKLVTVMVKGVDPRRVARVLDLSPHMTHPTGVDAASFSSLLASADPSSPVKGMIVGCELARRMELRVGDRVRMISPLSNLSGRASATGPSSSRSFDFRVSGIFCCGFDEYDKRLVYLALGQAQRFFEHGDVVLGVEARLADPMQAPALARDLLARLGGPPYRTVGWRELNRNLFLVVATQKVILTGVIGVIILVAAFNVLAGLAVLVLRKRREIAILKSLGASSTAIAWLFQAAGAMVWVVGASLGLLLGGLAVALLARYGFPLDARIYQISELPVRVNALEFLFTALFALILSALATLYPALRAARVDAVEGLRP
ncbi:MAG: ABC transporter permease, partial [Deltaproteobacteria bacterium]|nr:ABC transporter permease [Deltaproteobacteria bacterium]